MIMVTVDPNEPRLYLIGMALFTLQGVFSIVALIMSWTGLIWPYRGATICGILVNFIFAYVMYGLYCQLSQMKEASKGHSKEELEDLFKDVK